jgi:hypothetical protein
MLKKTINGNNAYTIICFTVSKKITWLVDEMSSNLVRDLDTITFVGSNHLIKKIKNINTPYTFI